MSFISFIIIINCLTSTRFQAWFFIFSTNILITSITYKNRFLRIRILTITWALRDTCIGTILIILNTLISSGITFISSTFLITSSSRIIRAFKINVTCMLCSITRIFSNIWITLRRIKTKVWIIIISPKPLC